MIKRLIEKLKTLRLYFVIKRICSRYNCSYETQKVIVHNWDKNYTGVEKDVQTYLCRNCIQELLDKHYFITIMNGDTSWIKTNIKYV